MAAAGDKPMAVDTWRCPHAQATSARRQGSRLACRKAYVANVWRRCSKVPRSYPVACFALRNRLGSPSGGHVPRVGVGARRTEQRRWERNVGSVPVVVPATAALMIVGVLKASTKGGRRWPVGTG